jgi:hypothetical protein
MEEGKNTNAEVGKKTIRTVSSIIAIIQQYSD